MPTVPEKNTSTEAMLCKYRSWFTLGMLGIGVSHKLQGLLMSLQGNAQLLRQDFEQNRAINPDFLGDIDAALERILLLTMGLQEAAQEQAISNEKVDLNLCCGEALEQLKKETAHINVSFNPATDLLAVEGDRVLVMLLVLELLSSAAKAALPLLGANQPRLKITTLRQNQTADVEILADGFQAWPLMDAEIQEKENFFSAHRSIKAAHSIMKCFGGEVEFSTGKTQSQLRLRFHSA